MRTLSCLLLALLLAVSARADSPITSTEFHKAYLDIPIVVEAKNAGVLNDSMCRYLSSNAPVDRKMALINALSWNIDGKQNKQVYERYLLIKYKTARLSYPKITADEQLSLGYLGVMDDYFNPHHSLGLLRSALARNPKSYTFNIIYGLALAQLCMERVPRPFEKERYQHVDQRYIDPKKDAWCNIYRIVAKVDGDKTLKADLRPAAKAEIFEYMDGYKEYCNKNG